MLSYAKVADKPRILKSLTGLSVEEFEQLLVRFEQVWQAHIDEHYVNAPRQRRYGGGRKAQLQDNRDKLLSNRRVLPAISDSSRARVSVWDWAAADA